MNPNRRRVRRSGARPSYSAARPSYSRRTPTGRPTTKRGGGFQLPRLSRPSLPVIRVRWFSLVAILVLIILLITLIGHLTALNRIKVQGNRSLATAHIDQLADAGLDHQWFGHNTLLVDSGSLATYLELQDPAIQKAVVHRIGLHTIRITVSERQPTLNWHTDGLTYLLDANATVIGPTTAAYAGLPTVTDSSNLPVKAGSRVAPAQFVAFCSQVAKLLPGVGYHVAAMTVPASTTEVYVTTDASLTLKFDTTRPAGEEIADLNSVTAELTSLHQKPTQYIDLRIAHKAYYQ